VSLSQLEAERPGNPHASLNDYYESMGVPYEATAGVMREKLAGLEPGEPAIVVRISPGGSTKIGSLDGEGVAATPDDAAPRIAVWELPEDEFYFFKAFRHGLFDLEKQVPAFLAQMAFVYAHTLFESYLKSILELRLHAHPQQIGRNKQLDYGAIFDSASKEELMARIIDRELSQLMYEPIEVLLDKMRSSYGFRKLATSHDGDIRRLTLTRNCLMHNAGKVSGKLAEAEPAMSEGQPITIQSKTISHAITVYRKFCLEIDQAYEALA
jgi:hypothetical protein